MAGATNRAFKAAGIPKKAMGEIRLKSSGPLTIQSAIQIAKQHGIALPEKALQRGAQRPEGPKAQPPPGWQAAARGDTRRAAEGAQRLADYRKAAEGHQRASDEGKRGLREQIREQIKKVNAADMAARRATEGARPFEAGTAEALNGARTARAELSRLVGSRSNIAAARKAERTPGQQDLFGVPQPKRAESPFERRMALRNARLAAAGADARKLAPNVSAVSRGMLANRKTAAANAKPSLERSLDNFKNAANKAAADYYAKQNFKNIKPPTLEFSDGGQRFIRVVRNDGTSKSAHSFIDKATGDIYKAASWKAPAKGVRGNIHKGEFNLDSSGQSRYSAAYEKRGTGPSKRPQWASAPIPKRAPAPGKASQADRAAIVAGRLLSRENMWGKVGAKDQRRANAILAKFPQVKDAARQLGKELNYRRAVRRGYGGDRKAFNMPSSGADVKRLVSIMR